MSADGSLAESAIRRGLSPNERLLLALGNPLLVAGAYIIVGHRTGQQMIECQPVLTTRKAPEEERCDQE
jgi:hypothetical protein